ncbi:MAG: hypothetical protein JWO71_2200 [Candidatus Acidoferrum typicum]|nr:hypothetical protein [Candidatus Acidoferrum typicum]
MFRGLADAAGLWFTCTQTVLPTSCPDVPHALPYGILLARLEAIRYKRGLEAKARNRESAQTTWDPSNPFAINTCKSVSKQMTLTSFRINTYEKQGEGGPTRGGGQ